MKILTTIIAPISIGVIAVIMALTVSSRTGAGDTFGLVMGLVSGVVISGALIYWSRRFRN